MFEWQQRPHARLNPLTGEWVLVSPQRTARPWQGEIDKFDEPMPLPYDPTCYLCPGNERAGGRRNPEYKQTFVFPNDFPALLPGTGLDRFDEQGLRVAEAEAGLARVLCFSPVHDLTLSRMDTSAVTAVVTEWLEQNAALGSLPLVNYVQIFENRGRTMGASNPHPHGQIWATHRIPNEIAKEQASQRAWMETKSSCLLCDYLALEKGGERVVAENAAFVALVPFWAIWPFETLVLSRRHVADLSGLLAAEAADLADILKRVTTRYDNLFESPCPYSMGFHQSPCGGARHDGWHLHAHFLPPVLRSASIRKFMVGYELLAMPQRDITPEEGAARLRSLPEIHYSER